MASPVNLPPALQLLPSNKGSEPAWVHQNELEYRKHNVQKSYHLSFSYHFSYHIEQFTESVLNMITRKHVGLESLFRTPAGREKSLSPRAS